MNKIASVVLYGAAFVLLMGAFYFGDPVTLIVTAIAAVAAMVPTLLTADEMLTRNAQDRIDGSNNASKAFYVREIAQLRADASSEIKLLAYDHGVASAQLAAAKEKIDELTPKRNGRGRFVEKSGRPPVIEGQTQNVIIHETPSVDEPQT